jgi:hypothetical protein
MSWPAARPAVRRGRLGALALACCAASHLACGARHGERPDAVPSTIGADAAAQAGADGGRDTPRCRVQRAQRTFVGFSDGMSLEHFELAAFEAERIVVAVQAQLCELDSALDPDGGLRDALRDGAVELTSIVFTQDDAGAADVQVRRVRDENAAMALEDPAIVTWSLGLTRTGDGWRVVAVVPL